MNYLIFTVYVGFLFILGRGEADKRHQNASLSSRLR
jgi:hypothetical protein